MTQNVLIKPIYDIKWLNKGRKKLLTDFFPKSICYTTKDLQKGDENMLIRIRSPGRNKKRKRHLPNAPSKRSIDLYYKFISIIA